LFGPGSGGLDDREVARVANPGVTAKKDRRFILSIRMSGLLPCLFSMRSTGAGQLEEALEIGH
jgi:hypothetical protein